ncbi:MAG: hypothetical protein NZ581_06835 [Candidatus Caldarchaeum sp.]|nr:hypothetical protein [Candidatus Caldarchaeum sp.]MDW8435893.1 hypothetical protein [Candidatus Caldarchaeum sp.]
MKNIENVVILSVEGDYPFKVFRGKLVVAGMEAGFEGVVYQSVGGPNVRTVINAEDAEALQKNGFSVETIELELQQKVLNGEILIEQNR